MDETPQKRLRRWMSVNFKHNKQLADALGITSSHLNKYFFVNPPILVLDVPFAVAENLTPQHENSRIKFLDKNKIGGHDYFRS